MRILIVVSCIIVLVLLFLTMQVPKISENKIEQAINDVQSVSEVQIEDQEALQDVVVKTVEQLERQPTYKTKVPCCSLSRHLVGVYAIFIANRQTATEP